jgi:hypothetical protein
MDKLDISMWAILKVSVSGIFIYIIAPGLFVLRDLTVLKIIERFVLTKQLQINIRLCESDRWQLEKLKKLDVKIDVSGKDGEFTYLCNGEKVSKEDYSLHDSALNMHTNRFYTLNNSINMRHNLILWLTKHYKQESLSSPIPEWRKTVYEREKNQKA